MRPAGPEVSIASEGSEVGARGLGLFQDVKEVLERARQPVEFPHDDDIALAQMIEHPVQLRPIPTAAGGLLLIDSGTAGRLEGTDLGRGILIIGLRDAGVAEQHRCRLNLLPLTMIWQQDFAQRKPLVLRLPRFRCVDDRL